MLEAQSLNKSYGRQKVLDNVNLCFKSGQSISLIGPNGSGKTTFLKCILGLVVPDSGEIFLSGLPISGKWDYRQRLGYMPQIGRYPDNMRVGQLFDMILDIRMGRFKNLDRELMESFEIEKFSDKSMRTLSGGMRQKVSACLAFLFDPDILILDEPTAGLDPFSTEILKEKVLREKQKGKLVLITSHILSDLEELSSDVIYIMDGKVQFFKSIDELRAQTGEELNRALARIMQEKN